MSGGYVCSFVVEACYDGKEPFFIGTFNIPRQDTFAATLAATDEATATAVGDFFGRHFPDGAPAPQAIKARLGSMMFVPDDYGWR